MKGRDGLSTLGKYSLLDGLTAAAGFSNANPGANAEALAEFGMQVFPCAPAYLAGALEPLVEDWREAATADVDAVADMWARHPDAEIAIRIPHDVVVIEVDPAADGSFLETEQLLDMLPVTVVLPVPEGRGRRSLVFGSHRGEIRPSYAANGPVRIIDQDSGYIVVPILDDYVTGDRRAYQIPAGLTELPPLPREIQRLAMSAGDAPRSSSYLDGLEATMYSSRFSDDFLDWMLSDFEDASASQVQWIYMVASAILARDDGLSTLALQRLLKLAAHARGLGFEQKDIHAAIRLATR